MEHKIKITLAEDVDLEEFSDLPVRISDASLQLVRRAKLNEEVPLKEGYYVASAVLPHGEEIEKLFEVTGDDRDALVALQTEAWNPSSETGLVADSAPESKRETRKYIEVGSWKGLHTPAHAQSEAPVVTLYSGNLLRDNDRPRESRVIAFDDEGRADLEVMGGLPNTLRSRFSDGSEFLVSLPISDQEPAYVELDEDATGPQVRVVPYNRRTALQLSYLASDLIEQAGRVFALDDAMQPSPELAEQVDMLQGKLRAPIAAAIGGYVLHMRGELEPLSGWVHNLANWFEWLPDGAILHAEHLARQGRHEEALEWFMGVQDRGLPIMSYGFRLMLKRMSEYASHYSKKRLSNVHEDDFTSFYIRLASISSAIVDSQPLLTLQVGNDEMLATT